MNATNQFTVEIGVANLPMTERLFLWAIRAWSAHHNDLSPVWWSLERAFACEDVSPALPHFHALMNELFAGLVRWPDIRCVACPRLGNDEARLLCMFAYTQEQHISAAQRELNDLVLRPRVRMVSAHAEKCLESIAHTALRFGSPQHIANSVNNRACSEHAAPSVRSAH